MDSEYNQNQGFIKKYRFWIDKTNCLCSKMTEPLISRRMHKQFQNFEYKIDDRSKCIQDDMKMKS